MSDSVGKIKNISGEDRLVPWLGGRLVVKDAVVEVPADTVTAYTQQESIWAPADDVAEGLHQEMLEAIAVLIAAQDGTAEEIVGEIPREDLIKVVIPGADRAQVLELVGAEEARSRPRQTVLSAAQERLEELDAADQAAAGETDPNNTPEV